MSALLARLLLSFVMLVATPLVYLVLFVIIEESVLPNDTSAFLASSMFTAIGVLTAWLMIWRRQVRWTPNRRGQTIGVVGLSCALAAMVAVLIGWVTHRGIREEGIILGGMTWLVGWLAGSVLVWRETPAERAERLANMTRGAISCPRCGYNLTGLQQARCPECGTQFTLDELFAQLHEEKQEQHGW
ncbi:MAG: hypothetical protein HJJLKODD_01872 [Phycisphaerae bacterium]|nr:hypothetical protein [Phycisphaerae bacterium]